MLTPLALSTENSLTADRDALWAEAVKLYHAGVGWWPDEQFAKEVIEPEQEARAEADPWEEKVFAFLDPTPVPGDPEPRTAPDRVTIAQVASAIGLLDTGRLGMAESRRIGSILRKHGWQDGKRQSHARWFVRPGGDFGRGAVGYGT